MSQNAYKHGSPFLLPGEIPSFLPLLRDTSSVFLCGQEQWGVISLEQLTLSDSLHFLQFQDEIFKPVFLNLTYYWLHLKQSYFIPLFKWMNWSNII